MKKKQYLFGLLLIVYSCNPAVNNQTEAMNYFDLKGYFSKEAARLSKDQPTLTKTVTVNNVAESREIRITDWTKELSVFSASDINRNAWKGLFKATSNGEQDRYSSDHEKVPVKELLIVKRKGTISEIRILVKNTNMLYSSMDTLSYFPDSLYQIKKNQQIKLLPERNYTITGKF